MLSGHMVKEVSGLHSRIKNGHNVARGTIFIFAPWRHGARPSKAVLHMSETQQKLPHHCVVRWEQMAGCVASRYFDSAAGNLDREQLDRCHSALPIRIQHRSAPCGSSTPPSSRQRGWIKQITPVSNEIRTGIPPVECGEPGSAIGYPETLPATESCRVRTRRSGNHARHRCDTRPRCGRYRFDRQSDVERRSPATGTAVGCPLKIRRTPGRPTIGPHKILLADSGPPDIESLVEQSADATTPVEP
ncbi:hypothetical protein ABH922_005354 [Rhodococcus sp. 27YEA15]